MKKAILLKVFVIAFAFSFSSPANAQGLLGKVKKVAQSAAKSVSSVVAGENEGAVKINCDSIPVYSTKAYEVTNEDGTTEKCYFLEDQFGNKRTAEAVKAQHQVILKSVGAIIAKVGSGAAIGALSGGKGGAIAGGAAGALASTSDIICLKKIHKSTKEANKMLEAYSKTFTEEGKAVDASADISELAATLGLDDSVGTMDVSEYNKLINSSDYRSEEVLNLPEI